MKIIVLLVGILLIAFISYWFFGKYHAPTATATIKADKQIVNVLVKGGYTPEQIELKQGVPATLNFKRTDASTCLEHIVFPDFGINETLPKDQTVAIAIDTSKAGTYEWACGMNMFHGKVIVK